MVIDRRRVKKIYHTDFELENKLCIISTMTLHKLWGIEHGADAVALYFFYYYTAKWQKTNSIKATPKYCMKGLGWGQDRFDRANKILYRTGLVKKYSLRDEHGRIVGWYVRLCYIWGESQIKHLALTESGLKRVDEPEPPKTTGVEKPPSGFQDTNALSVTNRNALSDETKKEILVKNAKRMVRLIASRKMK